MLETFTTSAANGKLWGERAEDWANFQEPMFRRVYETVLGRFELEPNVAYLDIGCGSGMAVKIASILGMNAAGLDASEALLAIARQRISSADLRQGELEDLPFADRSFDLVTGFNSFQYAANPIQALSQAKRVAKRGATVVIVTWGDPANMPAAKVVTALKPLLPTPAPNAPGPFALSDKSALEAFATSAGLEPSEVIDVESPWKFRDLSTALRALNSSGIAAKARAHSGDAAVSQAHEQALGSFQQPDGSYKVGATFRCLFATA